MNTEFVKSKGEKMSYVMDPSHLQAFFLRGAANTWAGEDREHQGKSTVLSSFETPLLLPDRTHVWTYEEQEDSDWMRYLDVYWVGAGGKSCGQTFVSFRNQLVWVMTYQGQYPEETILFLKEALQEAYDKGMFIGGRGPQHFHSPGHPGLRYQNNVSGTFERFHGEEIIWNSEGMKGFHRFQGMMLSWTEEETKQFNRRG